METSKLLEHLKNPRVYGNDVKFVDILQTHISFVALTGKYAYKVKKPVNFNFLDFSTIEKRKHFCEEEIGECGSLDSLLPRMKGTYLGFHFVKFTLHILGFPEG